MLPMRKVSYTIIGILALMIVSFYFGKMSKDTSGEMLFNKKRQCIELRDQAQKKMTEDFKIAKPFFYDIFYSSKTDSCLYHYGLLLLGESPNETGSFILADFFSGKTLAEAIYDNGSTDITKNSPFVREAWEKVVDSYRKNRT